MKNSVLICSILFSNVALGSPYGGGAIVMPPSADESPICSNVSECATYANGGPLKDPKRRLPNGNYQLNVSQDLAAHACAKLNKRLPTIREIAFQVIKKEDNRIDKSYPAVAVMEMRDFESGDDSKIPQGFKRKDFYLVAGLVPTHLPEDKNRFSVKIDGFYYANTNYKKTDVNLHYFSETSWVSWINSKSELDPRWPLIYNRVDDAFLFSNSTGDIWWVPAGLDIFTSTSGSFVCVKNVDEEKNPNWRTFPYVRF